MTEERVLNKEELIYLESMVASRTPKKVICANLGLDIKTYNAILRRQPEAKEAVDTAISNYKSKLMARAERFMREGNANLTFNMIQREDRLDEKEKQREERKKAERKARAEKERGMSTFTVNLIDMPLGQKDLLDIEEITRLMKECKKESDKEYQDGEI